MNHKTISYKCKSLLLSLVVLFFVFTLRVGVSSLDVFLIPELTVDMEGDDEQIFHSFNVVDDSEVVNNIDININEMKKLSVSSFLLMDFDDLDYSFSVSSNSSRIACFFQDIVLNYSSFVYKNVKLFLFYSFIKIPSVSL